MSRQHSFNIRVAEEIGIMPAVILNNIDYWIQKNIANNKHYYDGSYWTYNSVRAFSDLFPYVSANTIRNSLKKLEDLGYLKTGNYNKVGYDKTKWYSITNLGYCILQNKQNDLPKVPNGLTKSNEPIPNINTNINADINKTVLEQETRFNEFWKLYPRKENKKKALSYYKKINEETHDIIMNDLKVRVNSKDWKKDKGKYVMLPTTYLNGERWNDEIVGIIENENIPEFLKPL